MEVTFPQKEKWPLYNKRKEGIFVTRIDPRLENVENEMSTAGILLSIKVENSGTLTSEDSRSVVKSWK